jgi:hypothetical protein
MQKAHGPFKQFSSTVFPPGLDVTAVIILEFGRPAFVFYWVSRSGENTWQGHM